MLGRDRLRGHRLEIIVERHRRRPDVGALLEVHLGPRPAGIGQRVNIVIGRRRVGVGDDLLVLELAEELGERPERQAQLGGDPPARRHADIEQELEDQALDHRMVQARLLERIDHPGMKRPAAIAVFQVQKRWKHRGCGKAHVAKLPCDPAPSGEPAPTRPRSDAAQT